ncbi:DUF2141 domain-containing protein [Porphyromonas sp.]
MMRRIYIATLLALFFSTTTVSAQTTYRLTLNVVGMKVKKGNLLISVYNSAEDYLKKPLKTLTIPVDALTKRVTLLLEAGTYAIVIYQDENSNGRIDRNFFRLPTEPSGFSRDARPKFGPPRYKPASFSLSEDTEMQIKLK